MSENKITLRDLLNNIEFDYSVRKATKKDLDNGDLYINEDEMNDIVIIELNDFQNAFLGGYDSYIFSTDKDCSHLIDVADFIIERCDIYWNDYFVNGVGEILKYECPNEYDWNDWGYSSLIDFLVTHKTSISDYKINCLKCIYDVSNLDLSELRKEVESLCCN